MELFKPDPGLFFWMVLSFGFVLFILGKYAWPVITKGIEKRNQYIADALVAADEANEKLNSIREENRKMIEEAKVEQQRIIHEAQLLKEDIVDEAANQAKSEAAKIIEEAYRYIDRQREETVKELDRKVAEFSIEIAEKILRKNLDNSAEQQDLAKRLVDDLYKSRN